VPQFVQVFGFGKNERHWLVKLRAGCLPAQVAGCQPNATRFSV